MAGHRPTLTERERDLDPIHDIGDDEGLHDKGHDTRDPRPAPDEFVAVTGD